MEKVYPTRIVDLILRLRGNGPHAHVGDTCLRNLFDFVVETADVPGDIVDLGCGDGKVSAFLLACVEHLGLRKEVHAYDAFPVLPLGGSLCHPPDIGIASCDHAAGVDKIIATCDALGVSVPVIHAGWFFDTLPEALPAQISLAMISGAFHRSITESLLFCYPAMPDGAIGILDGYGLGFTPCVKTASDAFFHPKSENIEVIVAAAQAIFRRGRPKPLPAGTVLLGWNEEDPDKPEVENMPVQDRKIESEPGNLLAGASVTVNFVSDGIPSVSNEELLKLAEKHPPLQDWYGDEFVTEEKTKEIHNQAIDSEQLE